MNADQKCATKTAPFQGPFARKCRGHWHVAVGSGEDEMDLAIPGDPFPTLEAALDAIDKLKRERDVLDAWRRDAAAAWNRRASWTMDDVSLIEDAIAEIRHHNPDSPLLNLLDGLRDRIEARAR